MSKTERPESPARPAVGASSRATFDGLVLQGLGPVVSGTALGLLASALIQQRGVAAGAATSDLQLAAALSALVLLALRVALMRQAVAARWANAMTAGVAALAIGNSLAAVTITGDSVLVGYSLLVIVGCGAFLFSLPWLLGVVVATVIASLGVLWPLVTNAEMLRYGLALVAASGVSWLAFIVRRGMVLAALDASRREAARRHEVVATLQRSNDVWQLAVAASKGGWWDVAMDPRALRALPAGALLSATQAEVLGYGPTVMEWERWRGLIHPHELRKVMEAAERHLENATEFFEACYRIRGADDAWRWIEARGCVERDASGRAMRWCGLDWDVTEREKASRRFAQFQQVAVSSPNPTLITDAHGMIEYVNPSFVRVTGYSADEVLGKSPLMLDSEGTPNETHEEAWAMITAGHEWQGEFQNRHKDGARYRVQVSISPIRDDDGVISHFLLIHQRVRRIGDRASDGGSGLRSSAPY